MDTLLTEVISESKRLLGKDNIPEGLVETSGISSLSDKIIIHQNNLIISLLLKMNDKLDTLLTGKTLETVRINAKLDQLIHKDTSTSSSTTRTKGKPSTAFITK